MKLMVLKVVACGTVAAAVGGTLVLATVGPALGTASACAAEPAAPSPLLTSARSVPAARPPAEKCEPVPRRGAADAAARRETSTRSFTATHRADKIRTASSPDTVLTLRPAAPSAPLR